MRADGLWHPRLVQVIAAMGHTDILVVADAGLPVPPGVEAIDLLWSRRWPPLLPVLRGIVAELVVERAIIAEEAKDPDLVGSIEHALTGLPIMRTSHKELKDTCRRARAVVRTGEDTPYANVVLHAGVPF
ncbi:D-ribose pyranase [Jiangella asiatica]|uniref:D-ribose pyranase n=1 Tax=Jiangella asiatica TaxID=2530372 RepID=A0A4R5DIS7_9ACTN|nr:D-ribose pyranase [Jiangella asiatica]TDE10685.1 D-ribose pyranase [Jiangella asiatica]